MQTSIISATKKKLKLESQTILSDCIKGTLGHNISRFEINILKDNEDTGVQSQTSLK